MNGYVNATDNDASSVHFTASRTSRDPHSPGPTAVRKSGNMTGPTPELFECVVLPVASEEDAESAVAAARPYLESVDGRVVFVHVIEKAGGAPDKASVAQRKEVAEEIFDTARAALGDRDADTRIAYGTDVADTIREVADDVGATAIVFTPRDGNRWLRLLTGDVADSLVNESDRPVIVLPDDVNGRNDGADGADDDDGADDLTETGDE